MMQIRRRHWVLAIGAASAAHLSLAALFQQPPAPGAQAAGMGGVEIALGPSGGAAGTVTEAMPEEITAEALPEVETARPVKSTMAQAAPDTATVVEAEDVVETQPVVEAERVVEPKPVVEPEPAAPPKPVAAASAVEVIEPRDAETTDTPKLVAVTERPEARTPVRGVEVDPSTPAPAGTAARGPAGNRDSDEGASGDRSAGGGDPGARADYFARLQAWLERHRRYPRRAQLRGEEGTALIYFVIDRHGGVLDYRIERSSGHPMLDREVEAMLKRAQPLPSMPPELRQTRLELLLPIEFALR